MIVFPINIQALWKGNLSAECLYLSYGAVQFLSYRQVDALLKRMNASMPIPNMLMPFISGALCGCIATVSTYPFDLLRTRFAAQGNEKIYNSLSQAIRQIYRHEGIRGFFKGVKPAAIQIMPYMGINFGCYDIVKRELQV